MCSTGWFKEHDCKKVQLPFYFFKWYFCQNDKKPCKGKIGKKIITNQIKDVALHLLLECIKVICLVWFLRSLYIWLSLLKCKSFKFNLVVFTLFVNCKKKKKPSNTKTKKTLWEEWLLPFIDISVWVIEKLESRFKNQVNKGTR